MPHEIEEPRKLFGQSTSALSPKLFPSIVASLFLVIGAWLVVASFGLRERNDLRRLDRWAVANIGSRWSWASSSGRCWNTARP